MCNRTMSWTRNQLHITSRLMKKRRAPNPWNGFVKAELDKANAGKQQLQQISTIYVYLRTDLSELEVGDKYRLPKFISEHRDDLARQFRRLTEAQRKEYKLNIQTLRGEKQAVVRANPKAILKDFDTSFSAMEDEVGPNQSIILQVLI